MTIKVMDKDGDHQADGRVVTSRTDTISLSQEGFSDVFTNQQSTDLNVEQSGSCEASELVNWLKFNRDRRWSRRQKMALLQHFSGIQGAISVRREEAVRIFNKYEIKATRRTRSANIDELKVSEELAWLANPNHHLLSWFDPHYPDSLKHINDPPIALFAAGDLNLLSKPKVALVGSRRPSPAGIRVASEIAGGLAELDLVVVSGLALGIDSVAHRAALAAAGPTIAIVGSGMDVIYPRRHTKLFEEIEREGLILSEYPFGLSPSRYTFPDRNRLVSGLCAGVVVVEAANKSGTLITARLALEQDRELMVVPGPAFSDQYAGSHRLIKEGAALVCRTGDVLEQLTQELPTSLDGQSGFSSTSLRPDLSPKQRIVMEALEYDAQPIDAIIERCQLSTAEVLNVLLELELDGMVACSLEGGYIRAV